MNQIDVGLRRLSRATVRFGLQMWRQLFAVQISDLQTELCRARRFFQLQARQNLTSWNIGPGQATPPVVFEVSSQSTWHSDIWAGEQRKPAIFGRMGVKEYFAYDPHDPPVWSSTNGRRLLGWRYEKGEGIELQPDEQGRLWSEELNSWLKAEGKYLRLYDRQNNLRLTETEAAQQRIAELERQLRELKGANSQD